MQHVRFLFLRRDNIVSTILLACGVVLLCDLNVSCLLEQARWFRFVFVVYGLHGIDGEGALRNSRIWGNFLHGHSG